MSEIINDNENTPKQTHKRKATTNNISDKVLKIDKNLNGKIKQLKRRFLSVKRFIRRRRKKSSKYKRNNILKILKRLKQENDLSQLR